MSAFVAVVTTIPERVRLIERLRDDLRKHAIILSPNTIEMVLDHYDRRRARLS